MTQPVSKASAHFDELNNRIENKVKFDDFEFRRFLAEVKKIDSYVTQCELTGLAYAVQGRRDEAIANYKNALASSLAGFNTKRNYYLLLKKLGLYREAVEYGTNLAAIYNEPDFLNEHFLLNVLALDVSNAEIIYLKLQRMHKIEQREVTNMATKEMGLMKKACEHFVTSEQLALIGKAALKAAEDHGCNLMGNRISHSKESNHLSVIYVIDSAVYTSDEVFDINLSLIENLIDNELDTVPAVVQFVRLDKSIVSMDGDNMVLKTEEVVSAS